jgi:hypothetical protein
MRQERLSLWCGQLKSMERWSNAQGRIFAACIRAKLNRLLSNGIWGKRFKTNYKSHPGLPGWLLFIKKTVLSCFKI